MIPMTRILKNIRTHSESLCWLSALIVLFFLPENNGGVSLCLFSRLGFTHCPGCGIGHSVHYALHLQLATSFRYHPLGIPAVIIIFIRIKQLLYPINRFNET